MVGDRTVKLRGQRPIDHDPPAFRAEVYAESLALPGDALCLGHGLPPIDGAGHAVRLPLPALGVISGADTAEWSAFRCLTDPNNNPLSVAGIGRVQSSDAFPHGDGSADAFGFITQGIHKGEW